MAAAPIPTTHTALVQRRNSEQKRLELVGHPSGTPPVVLNAPIVYTTATKVELLWDKGVQELRALCLAVALGPLTTR